MSIAIDVDDEVYEALKAEAEPFVDSPNSVLRRLLGLGSADDGVSAGAEERDGDPASKEVGRSKSGGSQRRKSGSSRRRRTPAKRKRVPAGSILQEAEYELPLLESLVELGGSGPSRDVVGLIGDKLDDKLTALDRGQLGSGAIRWENRVQFVRLKLIERGLMKKDSPRGTWEITEAGREAVQRGSAEIVEAKR